MTDRIWPVDDIASFGLTGCSRCRPARRYSQGKSRLGAAIRQQTLSHWAHSSWRRLDFITERTSLPKFRSFWRFS